MASLGLESVSEEIRRRSASAVTHLAMRLSSRATLHRPAELPTGWTYSPADPSYAVEPKLLRAAAEHLEVANAIHADVTALNWSAYYRKLLGDWSSALAAYERLLAFASQAPDRNSAYISLARQSIEECKYHVAQGTPGLDGPDTDPSLTADADFCAVAESFAEALMDLRFDDALALMSASQQQLLTPQDLARSYAAMVPDAASVTEVGVVDVMADWPDKLPADRGWAYVSMSGDDFAEAVTVVVEEGAEGLRIRQVEWGRP